MKNLTAGYSRRNALQQMSAITMAAGLSGMVIPATAGNGKKCRSAATVLFTTCKKNIATWSGWSQHPYLGAQYPNK